MLISGLIKDSDFENRMFLQEFTLLRVFAKKVQIHAN